MKRSRIESPGGGSFFLISGIFRETKTSKSQKSFQNAGDVFRLLGALELHGVRKKGLLPKAPPPWVYIGCQPNPKIGGKFPPKWMENRPYYLKLG